MNTLRNICINGMLRFSAGDLIKNVIISFSLFSVSAVLVIASNAIGFYSDTLFGSVIATCLAIAALITFMFGCIYGFVSGTKIGGFNLTWWKHALWLLAVIVIVVMLGLLPVVWNTKTGELTAAVFLSFYITIYWGYLNSPDTGGC